MLKGENPMLVKIIVNCKTIKLKVYTGELVTLMPFNFYCKHFDI